MSEQDSRHRGREMLNAIVSSTVDPEDYKRAIEEFSRHTADEVENQRTGGTKTGPTLSDGALQCIRAVYEELIDHQDARRVLIAFAEQLFDGCASCPGVQFPKKDAVDRVVNVLYAIDEDYGPSAEHPSGVARKNDGYAKKTANGIHKSVDVAVWSIGRKSFNNVMLPQYMNTTSRVSFFMIVLDEFIVVIHVGGMFGVGTISRSKSGAVLQNSYLSAPRVLIFDRNEQVTLRAGALEFWINAQPCINCEKYANRAVHYKCMHAETRCWQCCVEPDRCSVCTAQQTGEATRDMTNCRGASAAEAAAAACVDCDGRGESRRDGFVELDAAARGDFGRATDVESLAVTRLSKFTVGAEQIMAEYPPCSAFCPNKNYVMNKITGHKRSEVQMEVTRHKLDQTRGVDWTRVMVPPPFTALRHHSIKGSFTFRPCDDVVIAGHQSTWWHTNFSDEQLLVYHNNHHCAQEELLALMHPSMASLVHALRSGEPKCGKVTDGPFLLDIGERTHIPTRPPTPILIKNVPYLIQIDTNGIYGRVFRHATHEVLDKQCTYIGNQQLRNNFISFTSMRTPGEGKLYTREQIENLLVTAIVGFSAAVDVTERDAITSTRTDVVIATGNWGCGAFGGQHMLMAMIQMIAASVTGVSGLVYYTFDDLGDTEYKRAREALQKINEKKSLAWYVQFLLDMKFTWRKGDGN